MRITQCVSSHSVGGTASSDVPLSRVLKLDKEEERFKMVHGLTVRAHSSFALEKSTPKLFL